MLDRGFTAGCGLGGMREPVDTRKWYLKHKDNYGRLNMIGRERAKRALIGCDSQ